MSDTNNSHPCTMAPLTTWLRLLWENGGVARPYWSRLPPILIPCAVATLLRLAEKVRYGRRIARTSIDKSPVFILGFPRSGTTHLHNLLAHDPQFGSISNYQAAVPTFSLIGRGWFERLMAKNMNDTRPMDNVKMTIDLPQEEEFAISNFCHLSYVHSFTFPQQIRTYMKKYALMRGLSEREQAHWTRVFLTILRKATVHNEGRQLVLKSPSNTGRIGHVLRLFPQAKFIHIIRNPYTVYESVLKMYRGLLPLFQLQDVAVRDIEELIFSMYKEVMQQYLRDTSLVAKGHLSEVRFERLEQNPLDELERVYAELELPNWKRAKGPISAYLQTVSDYQKNRYRLDPAVVNRINTEWHFALDAWQYQPPEDA